MRLKELFELSRAQQMAEAEATQQHKKQKPAQASASGEADQSRGALGDDVDREKQQPRA